jgi:hypothetical protein
LEIHRLSITKGHILESHHLSVTKKPKAEVVPLPLLAFVMLRLHLLVMLLKQKQNTHCLHQRWGNVT